jgi:hypothetical protein
METSEKESVEVEARLVPKPSVIVDWYEDVEHLIHTEAYSS